MTTPRAALKSLAVGALIAGAAWGALAQKAPPAAAAGAKPQAAAAASMPEIFRDADLPLGQRLIGEHACAACHIRRVGGDGSSIYNPRGRINTPGALRGMVDYCSTELNLGLFPEEVTAIAAVLQRDHYRFAVAPR